MDTRHYIIKITFKDGSFGYFDVNGRADKNINNAYVYNYSYLAEGPCDDDMLPGMIDAYDEFAGSDACIELLDVEFKPLKPQSNE